MEGIRLVYVTDDYSSINPGVSSVLRDLLSETIRFSDEISDIKLVSTGVDDYAGVPQGVEHVKLLYSSHSMIQKAWKCPADFQQRLDAIIKDSDIVHIHGIWMGPQYYAARLCIKHQVPFILTSHGMLEPWHWHDQGVMAYWKKWLYWKLIAYPVFRKAALIHAITPMEQAHLQALFPDSRTQVIPNAADVQQIGNETSRLAEADPEPIILFVGRIHPQKGIDLLIRAFASSGVEPPWALVIAGPEQVPEYARELKQLVEDNNLGGQVRFIGPVYGREKYEWYKRSWVVAVPSHTEVVGMVNLEASACGVPTITTRQTGLFNWEEGGGLLIEPNEDALANAIRSACAWTKSERARRRIKSLELVNQYYSWPVIGRQWTDLYSASAQGR